MEDTLWLRMELPSRATVPSPGIDIPDIEDAADANLLFGNSLPANGFNLRSGNSDVTKVTISAGERTKNGCTSTVSFGEVIALAGTRIGLP